MILLWLCGFIPGLLTRPPNYGESNVRVYLNGGPSHGSEVTVAPGTLEFRVAIPLPINVMYPFDQPDIETMPDHKIGIYRFMGTGFVSLDGTCTALIFQYQDTV